MLGQKQSRHKICHVQFGLQKLRAARIFSIPAISQIIRFTASQPRKKGRCLDENSQNSQFATFNLDCKNFARRELFPSQPFPKLHVLRRPNYAKMAVAWPKKVKTHNLPRLFWAAKSSHGASFLHPSLFLRYTSFTASQPRKKGRCLDKNSQNSQFATFNLDCKKFARRKLFSSEPFPTLHVFYGVPTTQKWPLPGQKQSKLTICHVLFGLQKVRAARTFLIPPISPVTRFYGVPTTQKWPLPGQ